MKLQLFLYGTSACHLCEQAAALLHDVELETSLHWTKIDIIDNEDLMQRYGVKIPVLRRADNAQELCWPFTIEDIRIFID